MDRSNVIEHLLLSRCSRFNENGDLLQFLEQRYSFTGPQKNYLVLESTDGGQLLEDSRKNELKESENINSFLAEKKRGSLSKNNKYSAIKTKNEFKKFVQQSLRLQENVTRKLNKLNKKNPNILKQDVVQLKICKGILKFEDFIEINNLWNNYIKELVKNSRTIDVVTAKLSTAEFVGAYFTVTHCSCSDNIGMEGIVLWESQTYILLIVPRKNNWKENISDIPIKIPYTAKECIGGLRMIPKKKTRFTFNIELGDIESESEEALSFEFIGDRLSIRSVDRANKKFKSHSVKDIEL
jgi:ribonuclease P protein subunit POP4